VPKFPFIVARLFWGIGLDIRTRRTVPNHQEQLATVFRHNSTERGMLVFNITGLDAIRYGIVYFGVSKG
jgi:hypothetical protein